MGRSNVKRKTSLLEQQKPVSLVCFEVVAEDYDHYLQPVKAQMISNWHHDGFSWHVEKAKNLVSNIPLGLFNERINFAEAAADFLALNCHSMLVNAALRTSNFPSEDEQIKLLCLKQVQVVIEASISGVSAEDVFFDRFKTVFGKLFNTLKMGIKRTA